MQYALTTNVITVDHKCNKCLTRNVTKKNNFSTISIDHFMFDNMYSRKIFRSTWDILDQLRKSSVLLKCFRKCSETFTLPMNTNDRITNKIPPSSVLRHPNEWSIRKPPLISEDRRQSFRECLITSGLSLNSRVLLGSWHSTL